MILRDHLAVQRTALANQRTLLAFVGTTLHFIILGLTFSKLEVFEGLEWLSIPAYALGLIVLIIGIINYRSNRKTIMRAYDSPNLGEIEN